MQHFLISSGFARKKGIPVSFTANVLRETAKAVYVQGHGEVSAHGACACCGRTLTHPGSKVVGIGPECLGNWTRREVIKESMTDDEIERIRNTVREQKVEGYVPKAVIKHRHGDNDEGAGEQAGTQSSTAPAQGGIGRKAKLVEYEDSAVKAIMLQFDFNRALVDEVKTIPGRRFHNNGPKPADKFWTVPLSLETVQSLQEMAFDIDQRILDWVEQKTGSVEQEDDDIEIPGLKGTPFPYQRKGVQFLERRNGRGLIADEMGLGKTIQALAWLQLHPEARPAIIVCPASLKLNWAKEIFHWMESGTNVQMLHGTKPHLGEDPSNSILIINYEILAYWSDTLNQIGPQVVVTDEAHKYKNNQAKRTKAVKKLAKGVPHFIALSGTPIVNRPIEMYNALKLVDSSVVPGFWGFAKRYCGARHNGFGWDFTGATNTDELHDKLVKTVMIRRRKADVLQDLPDKLHSAVPLEIDNRQEYDKASRDVVAWLAATEGEERAQSAKNSEMLARINTLKKLAARGKLKSAINWVSDHIESGNKIVVFVHHKEIVQGVKDAFGEQAVKVDGSMSQEDRNKSVEAFQNDDNVMVFIGNMQAAGVGLTLTAASDVAFIELPWTPGELVQAEDRCHRIGQKNTVNVYYLLAADTIDEDIADLLSEKRKVLDAVIDGQEPDEASMLSELISNLKEAA